ncbi:MAG: hypothetical protein V1701_09060 [Planctomycetota bacterium]
MIKLFVLPAVLMPILFLLAHSNYAMTIPESSGHSGRFYKNEDKDKGNDKSDKSDSGKTDTKTPKDKSKPDETGEKDKTSPALPAAKNKDKGNDKSDKPDFVKTDTKPDKDKSKPDDVGNSDKAKSDKPAPKDKDKDGLSKGKADRGNGRKDDRSGERNSRHERDGNAYGHRRGGHEENRHRRDPVYMAEDDDFFDDFVSDIFEGLMEGFFLLSFLRPWFQVQQISLRQQSGDRQWRICFRRWKPCRCNPRIPVQNLLPASE